MTHQQPIAEMRHSRIVPAPPELVWQALLGLRAADLPLVGLFVVIRDIPSRLAGRLAVEDASRTLVERAAHSGFGIVRREPGRAMEMARIARFWQPVPTNAAVPADRAEFEAFAEPGFAKALITFELTALDGRTAVETVTKVWATDDEAKRRFRLYWLLAGGPAGLLRSALLAAAERRAVALAAEAG
ncbi:hypothetical protein [Kitasatospora sp. NPDC056181]|uniref:hypothetical protein n=1 Tax=Kitasatospora sp. NPDC056181 TaxID=3345737 RepID=UPI0035D77D4F